MHTRQWYVFFAYMLRIIQVNMALLFWVEAWKKVQINSWNLLFCFTLGREFWPLFKFYFLHLVLPRGTRFEAKFFSSLRLMPKFLKLFFCCCCFREVLQFFNLCFPQKVPLVQKSWVPFKFFFYLLFYWETVIWKKTLLWVSDDLATSFISLELAFNGTQVWQQLGAIIR